VGRRMMSKEARAVTVAASTMLPTARSTDTVAGT
jgi:hypothetical protein